MYSFHTGVFPSWCRTGCRRRGSGLAFVLWWGVLAGMPSFSFCHVLCPGAHSSIGTCLESDLERCPNQSCLTAKCFRTDYRRREVCSLEGEEDLLEFTPDDRKRVVIGFETKHGRVIDVVCTRRPLGVRCTRWTPVTVIEVSLAGHAFSLGVKNGWKVRYVDGKDMQGQSSEVVHTLLFEQISTLPSLAGSAVERHSKHVEISASIELVEPPP